MASVRVDGQFLAIILPEPDTIKLMMPIFSIRNLVVLVCDLTTVVLAVYLAFVLRLQDLAIVGHQENAVKTLGLAIGLYAFSVYQVGLLRGLWRYMSSYDVYRLLGAVTIITLGLVVADFLLGERYVLPRSSAVIYWFLQLAFFVGTRFFYRSYRQSQLGGAPARNNKPAVLLFGHGEQIDAFLRSNVEGNAGSYRVVGILSGDGRHAGHSIRNVPILGKPEELDKVLRELARRGLFPRKVIVTNQDYLGLFNDDGGKLLQVAKNYKCAISRVDNRAVDLDESTGPSVVPIRVEDLLFRDQGEGAKPEEIAMFAGRRVLVTGGGGSIGLELCRQIAAIRPASMVVLDNSEFNLYSAEKEIAPILGELPLEMAYCSIRDRERLWRIFERFQPDFVVHAAAMKHVPIVENNLPEGVLTNIVGTRNVADACIEFGVEGCILISTDKAVHPTNFMGCTKRVAEMYCLALNEAHKEKSSSTRFVAVRFGNVLGSSGSVVPLFKKQIEMGGPVTVTHPEMTRFFMTIPEAVSLVLQAFSHGFGQKARDAAALYVLDMGKPIKIIELARQMIKLSGHEPNVDIDIVISKIRPGEKLEEELFLPDEELKKLDDKAIFLAKSNTLPLDDLQDRIAEFEQAARRDDHKTISKHMRELVDGYLGPEG